MLYAPLGHYVSAHENRGRLFVRNLEVSSTTKKHQTERLVLFCGGEDEIRTRASGIARTNPLAGDPLIASWVLLHTKQLLRLLIALI